MIIQKLKQLNNDAINLRTVQNDGMQQIQTLNCGGKVVQGRTCQIYFTIWKVQSGTQTQRKLNKLAHDTLKNNTFQMPLVL